MAKKRTDTACTWFVLQPSPFRSSSFSFVHVAHDVYTCCCRHRRGHVYSWRSCCRVPTPANACVFRHRSVALGCPQVWEAAFKKCGCQVEGSVWLRAPQPPLPHTGEGGKGGGGRAWLLHAASFFLLACLFFLLLVFGSIALAGQRCVSVWFASSGRRAGGVRRRIGKKQGV